MHQVFQNKLSVLPFVGKDFLLSVGCGNKQEYYDHTAWVISDMQGRFGLGIYRGIDFPNVYSDCGAGCVLSVMQSSIKNKDCVDGPWECLNLPYVAATVLSDNRNEFVKYHNRAQGLINLINKTYLNHGNQKTTLFGFLGINNLVKMFAMDFPLEIKMDILKNGGERVWRVFDAYDIDADSRLSKKNLQKQTSSLKDIALSSLVDNYRAKDVISAVLSKESTIEKTSTFLEFVEDLSTACKHVKTGSW